MITHQQLTQLDKQIDSSITALDILAEPRDVALIHLLRYFEDYVRLYAPNHLDPLSYQVTLKNGQDGMHFAVQWIFKYCAPPIGRLPHKTNDQIYSQAKDLHERAMDYSMVWDLLTMVWRQRATAEREAGDTLVIRHANQLAADAEIADRLIGTSDDPSIGAGSLHSSVAPDEFLREVRADRDRAGTTNYLVPATVFDRVAEGFKSHASRLSELDGSWDLGGYTVSQFRELWISLLSLCWIHFWACFSSGMIGGDLDNVVIVSSREDWIKRLGRYSGVSQEAVKAILSDLTYDVNLYQPKSKHPGVTYQPFFTLHSDFLALSNWLVLLSSYERNIWDLVSIKRPMIHSHLRNKKEEIWLSELNPFLDSCGFSTYGPMRFTVDGRSSDLDLLILDQQARFGLCCQLKWLTTPDRIRDVKYTEDELNTGLRQAQLSLKWVTSLPAELPAQTGVSRDELSQYEFRAFVLSKNTIGSGWIYMPGVPIVNDRLLKWVLAEPHCRSLRALWQVGKERRYLPKRGKHFRDEDVKVGFANIDFLGKGMGMRIIGRWDPALDIDLTDIP